MGRRILDAMARLRRSPWPWLALILVWPLPGASHEALPSPLALVVPNPRLICIERGQLLARLARQYDESVYEMGLTLGGSLVELLISADVSTWTIVVTDPGKPPCIVGAGKHWVHVSSTKPVLGDPS